jgi:AcrR family transcriptional regulator
LWADPESRAPPSAADGPPARAREDALAGADERRRGGRRPGAGRPRRRDVDTEVLNATIAGLGRVGYGGLRVDDVSESAGVAKSTIYRRWPSKAALVAAAVRELYLTHVQVPDTGSLQSDLSDLLSNSYELLIAGPGRVFEGLIRESGQRPELVEVVFSTMHARRRFYFQVFNRAIARGELAPETDVGLAVDLLLGPLWVRLLVTGDPIDLEAIDRIVDIVLCGLIGAGTTSDG